MTTQEKQRAYHKQWVLDHKQQVAILQKKWIKDNPERVKMISKRYMDKLRTDPVRLEAYRAKKRERERNRRLRINERKVTDVQHTETELQV